MRSIILRSGMPWRYPAVSILFVCRLCGRWSPRVWGGAGHLVLCGEAGLEGANLHGQLRAVGDVVLQQHHLRRPPLWAPPNITPPHIPGQVRSL